ncbi:hypothetical protein ZW22_004535 [Salmonella enterica subsp. enterica serovar Oranienburg]|nr:hypothetical protein [Salmonella enterica subsp. enterica serovar Oranienburg]
MLLSRKKIDTEDAALKKELALYKQFFDEVKLYSGTYPAWKVLHEFSEAVHENRNTEYVQQYLEKVVTEIGKVLDATNPPEAERWKQNRKYIYEMCKELRP